MFEWIVEYGNLIARNVCQYVLLDEANTLDLTSSDIFKFQRRIIIVPMLHALLSKTVTEYIYCINETLSRPLRLLVVFGALHYLLHRHSYVFIVVGILSFCFHCDGVFIPMINLSRQ